MSTVYSVQLVLLAVPYGHTYQTQPVGNREGGRGREGERRRERERRREGVREGGKGERGGGGGKGEGESHLHAVYILVPVAQTRLKQRSVIDDVISLHTLFRENSTLYYALGKLCCL